MSSTVLGFGDINQIKPSPPPNLWSQNIIGRNINKIISSSNKCDPEEKSMGIEERSSGTVRWVW